jgi:hypothetical protein
VEVKTAFIVDRRIWMCTKIDNFVGNYVKLIVFELKELNAELREKIFNLNLISTCDHRSRIQVTVVVVARTQS